MYFVRLFAMLCTLSALNVFAGDAVQDRVADLTVDETIHYLKAILARSHHITESVQVDDGYGDHDADMTYSYSLDDYNSSTKVLTITENRETKDSLGTSERSTRYSIPLLSVRNIGTSSADSGIISLVGRDTEVRIHDDGTESSPEEKEIGVIFWLPDDQDREHTCRALQHLLQKVQGKEVFVSGLSN